MSQRSTTRGQRPVRRAEDPLVVLPPPLAWSIVAICVLPSLLILLGVELGTTQLAFDPMTLGSDGDSHELFYSTLRGSFVHTLWEWTAVCIAVMTALLALLHYRSTSNPITPVIFVALLAAACADMVHILIADRTLLPLIAESRLGPLTWGISRVYFASILVLGVAGGLLRAPDLGVRSASAASILRVVLIATLVSTAGVVLIGLSYGLGLSYEVQFPDRFITHPLDIAPLVLLLIGTSFVFPHLHRRSPSIFSHSLLLTSLPAVATQIHMAFGSREAYDAHFNAAHFLKMVTYFVPLLGLAFDYARTYEATAVARVRLENEMRVRRDMQDQLWGTEAVNEAILASVVDAIVTVDARGRIEAFNPGAETLFGFSESEAVGRPATILAASQWRPALEGLVDRSAAPDDGDLLSTHFEMVGQRSDGASFPVELTISEFEVEGLVRCALVLRDMTERREASEALSAQAAQLKRRTADLSRSNQELEKFAYVASHDLQEPLRMVYSFTDVLADHLGDELDDEGLQYMEFIRDGVTRMRMLIADLLTFSRVGAPVGEHSVIALQDAVQRAMENLRVSIDEAEVIFEIEPLPGVRADLTEIAQVFQNLIGNSLKFRGEAIPNVRISAERREGVVCISVEDNGIGIDMDYAEKVFVLFQRLHTRDRYPGTGIGLALCRKIVERYGGTIQVESAEGEGATFRFTLPAA